MSVHEFRDKTSLSDRRTKNTFFVLSLSVWSSEILPITWGLSPLLVVFFLVVHVFLFGPCALWSDGMLRGLVHFRRATVFWAETVWRSCWGSTMWFAPPGPPSDAASWRATATARELSPCRTSGRWGLLQHTTLHSSTCSAAPERCHSTIHWFLMNYWCDYWAPFVSLLSKCLKENDGEWLEIHAAQACKVTHTHTHTHLVTWQPISNFNCLIKLKVETRPRWHFGPGEQQLTLLFYCPCHLPAVQFNEDNAPWANR